MSVHIQREFLVSFIGADANLLHKWHPYGLHARLLRSLHSQNFNNPTPIQEVAIPAALKGKDVVGVAETVRFALFVKRYFLIYAVVRVLGKP